MSKDKDLDREYGYTTLVVIGAVVLVVILSMVFSMFGMR